MLLTKANLPAINTPGLVKPNKELFDLPEKVLQFGTGVLLRGLPDYLIDDANRKGIFNGRIIVVKSTNSGSVDDFNEQDGLYTLHIKGIDEGRRISEQIICSAVSRVISATDHWATILNIAHSTELKIIISNTTEVGIEFISESITNSPPASFPGKLLAFLYERFKAFKGTEESGLIIIPTELITNNGKKLKAIVLKLAHLNKLETVFISWLDNSNHFCDSLVDRIVPGKPAANLLQEMEKQFGYQDNLCTIAETYCLWAIEGNEKVSTALSFSNGHNGVIVAEDIEMFRELKLRLLNGTHTLVCAVAVLSGFATVKEAMQNNVFSIFITKLMLLEIAPAIPYKIDKDKIEKFAYQVLDRFRNPDIEHLWLSISAQYSMKLRMRVVPLLLNHYKTSNDVPRLFALGFAAFIRFMKISKEQDQYYGNLHGFSYVVKDNSAGLFYNEWLNVDLKQIVKNILTNEDLWGSDLSQLPEFENAVLEELEQIIYKGTLQVLSDRH